MTKINGVLTNFMITIGDALKHNRIVRNKTLQDIANATGISITSLSMWENNKSLPNIDFCVKLADLYGIPLNELVGLDLKK